MSGCEPMPPSAAGGRRWRPAEGCAVRAAAARSRAFAEHRCQGGEHADHGSRNEKHQQHQDQRRLPHLVKIKAQADRIGVLQREQEQRQEQDNAQDPGQDAHGSLQKKQTASKRCRLLSLAVRALVRIHAFTQFLAALKCGTNFSGTWTLSPDFGFLPVRGGDNSARSCRSRGSRCADP